METKHSAKTVIVENIVQEILNGHVDVNSDNMLEVLHVLHKICNTM